MTQEIQIERVFNPDVERQIQALLILLGAGDNSGNPHNREVDQEGSKNRTRNTPIERLTKFGWIRVVSVVCRSSGALPHKDKRRRKVRYCEIPHSLDSKEQAIHQSEADE